MVEDKTIAVICGLGAITILESIALLKGHNGALLMAGLSGIGALVGFVFGFKREKEKAQGCRTLKEYLQK